MTSLSRPRRRVRLTVGNGCVVASLLGAALFVSAKLPAQDTSRGTTTPRASFVVDRTGRGPPMILIPGLTSPGSVWSGAVSHWRSRYDLHVVTLAGFAGVPPIEQPSLARVRDDLIAYIRAQRLEGAVLVGHSVGGLLAYWVACTAPDLIGAVISLDGATFLPALFDTAATPERAAQMAARMRQSIGALSPEAFARQSDRMLAGQIKDSVARARVADLARRSDPTTTAQYLSEPYLVDLRDSVAAIRAPVLLLVSTEGIAADARAAFFASARRQVARISGARIVEVPDSRHFIMLDAPEAFLKTADAFLASVRRGGRR